MILAATLAAASLATPPALPLRPCVVRGVDARCGTFVVPENRARIGGRRIGLHVVVIPALRRPARPDAFTYLAGGPGGAATDAAWTVASLWGGVHERHDILLVDQRGTGGSNPLSCPEPGKAFATEAQFRAYVRSCLASVPGDAASYGTRAAMDDLDAVRKALGYRQLDLYGTSYGATAAQVFLRQHPGSVRTVVLDGGTALGVPFFGRYAANAQHALADVARRCAADPACAGAFPHWRRQLSRLVAAWDEQPVRLRPGEPVNGSGLASVVQSMLLDPSAAASIPLLVSRAAKGDYRPLNLHIGGGGASRQLMFWSIWCNEPWVGLGAKGPWGTDFDGTTADSLSLYATACASMPERAEPSWLWTTPTSQVPLLALAGGADPQDPIANLPDLKRHFPNGRAIVVPGYGHTVGQFGCLGEVVSRFVERGSAAGLATNCAGGILPPPFDLG